MHVFNTRPAAVSTICRINQGRCHCDVAQLPSGCAGWQGGCGGVSGGGWRGENLNHRPTLGCRQEVMSGLPEPWPWRSVFHYAAQTAERIM